MSDSLSIDRQLAQIFMTSARCACFRQAARSLNMQVVPMRKRLRKLEESVGSPLFLYKGRELSLSATGRQLQQTLARQFGDLHPEGASIQRPLVRLAVPTALLTDLLARDLISWLRKHAAARLEIIPLEGEPEELVDVMVWIADPAKSRPNPGFAMTKPLQLARISYCAYMAKRYAGKRLPRSVADLNDFMLVQYAGNTAVDSFEPWNQLIRQRQSSVVQVHSQEWVADLLRNSSCIGLLPNYISNIDRNLLPLDELFELALARVVWVSTSPLTSGRQEVQELLSLIRKAFDDRHTWFTKQSCREISEL
ncbi:MULTISPECIES: LysR family transcriptional regulator [Pseudomonas]|uniref:LysR family transcriptional regulator n=1 Tax=Pseudomonas marincola TaxID=437900 RepID=A0A653E2R0_9PSED|nr:MULTISPECIES: LysR family transcriptional regulator [Pseudomonas]MBQ55661.1 LysR family transcriptional regulator [Pseudomonadaceae bacterium]OEO25771.1 LysR family transcriptional regulator [Pseudomonas sp. J237]CAE6952686.1 LysR family transcriptional regulator [Pseudomonas marincola]HCP53689.1 LysR family transcriptional regulator [Pseudomonas sp.]